jgi:hypothetical protein
VWPAIEGIEMGSKQCSKCQGSMTEGFVVDTTYGGSNASQWAAGVPMKSFWGGVKVRGKVKHTVQSWRCQRCGLLENYATS